MDDGDGVVILTDVLGGTATNLSLFFLENEKKINRLENIALRSVDLVEVWQETGSDYVTVKFLANLLDYTVDEATGQVISGSKTDPVKFQEYWTFTRPVGNHPWKLSAIQQP